jgi:glucose-6-phosphate 1-dehydrogenase
LIQRYLATPPLRFGPVAAQLAKAGCTPEGARVIVGWYNPVIVGA